jgi:SAM-dependent methyltransferase
VSAARCDAALAAARSERQLAVALRTQPWRAVAAEAARRDPRRAGRLAAHGGAAPLALLALDDVADALVLGDVWAAIAVPLARRCRVRCLLATPAAAAICAAVAAQEGVALAACSGRAAAPPCADTSLDLIVVQGAAELRATADPIAALRALRRLLRPAGLLYLAGTNAIVGLVPGAPTIDEPGWSLAEYRALWAAAGLVERRAYACLPHYAAPRDLVPLALVPDHVARHPDAVGRRAAQLAPAGLAEHAMPSFAFVLAAAEAP